MEQSDTMGSTAILDDNQNDYYVLLSDEQAVSAVESIFQFEKKSTEPLPSNNDEIRIDNNVVQSLATSGDDGNSQSLPSKSSKSRCSPTWPTPRKKRIKSDQLSGRELMSFCRVVRIVAFVVLVHETFIVL